MKKTIRLFATIAALFFAVSASGQNKLGLLAGFNTTNIIAKPVQAGTGYKPRTRLLFGAFYDMQVATSLQVRLEPMLVQKGALLEVYGDGTIDGRIDDISQNYIELPILAKYNLGKSDTAPYVLAGPSLGFLISASQKAILEEIDIKDLRSALEVGFSAGIGLVIPTSTSEVFIELRYNIGLSNALKGSSEGESMKNNGVRLLFGIGL